METATRPQLPVPPPLRGEERGSFAHTTIVERLPRILERVLQENEFPAHIIERLEGLLQEIPEGSIRILHDTAAPDAAAWIRYIAPYLEQNWLQVPWFFAETYFYRRILEATGYFQEGAMANADPFAPHKEQSLEASWPRLMELAERMQSWRQSGWEGVGLRTFLSLALWGNQGDLSMWPGGAADMPAHDSAEVAREHVLVDDGAAVADYVSRQKSGATSLRIDVLADNAGYELISDLALVDYLLDSGQAGLVVLHVKAHPTFVSDALPRDVRQTIEAMAQAEAGPLQLWGHRLQAYLQRGLLQMTAHLFWTSPLPAWEMPPPLRNRLAAAALVISKGDANYRRLLGDRHWSYTAPFKPIVAYFPAPLLALRTLKSEVACGLPTERVAELNANHPDWTTSGDWGIIQFTPLSQG